MPPKQYVVAKPVPRESIDGDKAFMSPTAARVQRSSFMPSDEEYFEQKSVPNNGFTAATSSMPSTPAGTPAKREFKGFGRHNSEDWRSVPSIMDLHQEHTKRLQVDVRDHLEEITNFPENVKQAIADYLEASDVLFLGTSPNQDDSYFLHVPTNRVYSLRYWSILKVDTPRLLVCTRLYPPSFVTNNKYVVIPNIFLIRDTSNPPTIRYVSINHSLIGADGARDYCAIAQLIFPLLGWSSMEQQEREATAMWFLTGVVMHFAVLPTHSSMFEISNWGVPVHLPQSEWPATVPVRDPLPLCSCAERQPYVISDCSGEEVVVMYWARKFSGTKNPLHDTYVRVEMSVDPDGSTLIEADSEPCYRNPCMQPWCCRSGIGVIGAPFGALICCGWTCYEFVRDMFCHEEEEVEVHSTKIAKHFQNQARRY